LTRKQLVFISLSSENNWCHSVTGNWCQISFSLRKRSDTNSPLTPILLVLWDVQTGELQKSVQAWANELYTVDWTPDGSMLVTGGYNSPLTFWNSTELTIVAEFESPEWIMSARFSPDGTKLIFSGQNRSPENRYVETWAVP
jgi:WD40 repeat protein